MKLSVSEHTIDIQTQDGYQNRLTVFEPCADSRVAENAESPDSSEYPVVLFHPAMGVRASFYRPMAELFAGQGLTLVTADLRGNGEHSARTLNGDRWGYEEMLMEDFTKEVAALKSRYPGRPLVLGGHSLGGQLSCLYSARHPQQVNGVWIVAACNVHWRGWPGIAALARLAQFSMLRVVTEVMGYLPGTKIGFGGTEPVVQMRDWSRNSFTGQYRLRNASCDDEALLSGLAMPVLAVTFSDDDYAPAGACTRLLDKMKSATKQHMDIRPDDVKRSSIGHFHWVKQADFLMDLVVPWFEKIK